MQINGANLPFHIAKAYAPNATRPAAPKAPENIEPAARIGQTNPTPGVAPPNAARLVAGVVPGNIDFSGAEPAPAPAALPFYNHPADTNAAATAIRIGRSIDVSG